MRRRVTFAFVVGLLTVTPGPAGAADGTIVFFRSALVGGRELPPRVYTMNGDGTKERPLKPALTGYSPLWTAGGKRIAVFDFNRSRLTTTNRNGRDRRSLALGLPHNPRSGSYVLSFDIAPDGNRFAFGYHHRTRDFPNSSYVRPPTGPPVELPGTADEGLIAPVFSPDGNTLAVRLGSIWLAPADGSEPARQLAPLNYPGISDSASLAWSPDGRTIAAGGLTRVGGNGTLQLVQVATGAVRLLATDSRRSTTVVRVAFSPDGKRIAYESRGGRSPAQIWTYHLGSGKNTKLITKRGGGGFSTFAWSPDSRQIAVGCTSSCKQPPQGIWAVSLERKWTRLTAGRDNLGDWAAR